VPIRIHAVALAAVLACSAAASGCGTATYYTVKKQHSGRTAVLAAIGVSLAALTAAISADSLIVNRGSDEDVVAPFTIMVITSEVLVPVIIGLASSLEDNN
jgi:hypothetical protein